MYWLNRHGISLRASSVSYFCKEIMKIVSMSLIPLEGRIMTRKLWLIHL